MEIVLDWEGKIEDGEGEEAVKTSGSLRFPEVCEEVEDMDELEDLMASLQPVGDDHAASPPPSGPRAAPRLLLLCRTRLMDFVPCNATAGRS